MEGRPSTGSTIGNSGDQGTSSSADQLSVPVQAQVMM
jgi:hypothetical protein